MEKKRLAVKWQEVVAIFSSIFLSGCVTLAKSQENFAKEMHDKNGTFAAAAAVMAQTPISVYILFIGGLLVSSFGGYYVVSPYLKSVKKYLNLKAKTSDLTVLTGCAERAIYTTAFVVEWYAVIAAVLALKLGWMVVNCVGLETKKTGKIISSFVFGSLISLAVAIIVGVIVRQLLFRV